MTQGYTTAFLCSPAHTALAAVHAALPPGMRIHRASLIRIPGVVPQVYLRYAKNYGCQLTERDILRRFRR